MFCDRSVFGTPTCVKDSQVSGHRPWGVKVIIIIIKIESAVQGLERVRTLYKSEDSKPTQQNTWKEEKEKIVGDKKKVHIMPTRKH